MNILNNTDWLVQDTQENNNTISVTASYLPMPTACPHCGCEENFVRFGSRPQEFRDTPAFGKQVVISTLRQRFRCKDCGKTFNQPIPDVDERRNMTKRCVAFIEERALDNVFSRVASDVGVTEGTVRNVFAAYTERMANEFAPETPEWLGLDEVYLLKKPRCVVTNIRHSTIVDMLADRNKPTVQRYLQLLPDRDRIQVVTMDMWTQYRDAVRTVLPKAVVVVDKFHVVKLANFSLDKVRKGIREKLSDSQRKRLMRDRRLLFKRKENLTDHQRLVLDTWLGNFPVLQSAYDAKEAFYELYAASTRSEAEAAYETWQASLTPEQRAAFKDVLTAVRNWKNEIFAYFDHRTTNAYTEALNGLIKIANRGGRGYSFDVIRAKILYKHGVRKERLGADMKLVLTLFEEPQSSDWQVDVEWTPPNLDYPDEPIG